MKTKYLLLLVLSIFCYINSKAEEKKISLFCTCTEECEYYKAKAHNSLKSIPQLTTINLYQ